MSNNEETALEQINDPVNEYFVSHIGRTEIVEGILARLYCYKQMGNRMELQYTVLVPIKRMAQIGRQCLQAASEINGSMWEGDRTVN